MQKDPVCGKQIDETKATVTSLQYGERYVFCGQKCKDNFDRDPERYLPATPEHQEPQHS